MEDLHLRRGLVRLRGDIPCSNNKWGREDPFTVGTMPEKGGVRHWTR